MSWDMIKLGDLYEVHNGLSKGGKYFGKGYPFLTFSTVFNNYFIPDTIVDLVQSTEKEQESYSIKRGDVFVTRTSETSDELGMSCVALKDYPKAAYNGFTKRMRPLFPEKIFPEYIGYYMRMPSFRGCFQAFSTMTTRASLKNEDLLSLKIALPPLEIQVRIAGILRAYDKLIENNQKQIRLLEEAAQRLYKEWFVDLRFPGYENIPIIDGVPEGWKIGTLGEIATFKRGKTITKAQIKVGNVPVVAGGLEPAYYHNQSNTVAPVITVSGSGANAGFARLYNTDVFASDCSFADIETTPYIYFTYCFLKDNRSKLDTLQKGSAQPHVYAKDINSLELLIPNEMNLKQFIAMVSPYFKKVSTLQKQIESLKEARDRLLPKLMNGELEV